MLVLYHNWLSPDSRFIRIVLAEKRVDYSLRLEKDWERRVEFLKLSPAGTLPVLTDEDSVLLSDSVSIAEYLEECHPEPALIHGDALERAETRHLVNWFRTKFAEEISNHLVTEKLFKRFLRMGQPDSEAVRCAMFNLRTHLEYIAHLVDRRHYLAGDRFSLADAAAAAHLSVADYFGDVDWQRWPVAKDWYMRVKSRRSMRAILEDRIAGLAPPRHYAKLDF